MLNLNRSNVHKNLLKECYIAKKREETIIDEDGNEVVEYDTPESYRFNLNPVSSSSEIRMFGELSSGMRVALLHDVEKFNGMFKEYDLAYLDGVKPNNEIKNGANANYRIYSVFEQNTIIKIYFIKLVK